VHKRKLLIIAQAGRHMHLKQRSHKPDHVPDGLPAYDSCLRLLDSAVTRKPLGLQDCECFNQSCVTVDWMHVGSQGAAT
jgi:hypothetical protein